MGLNTSSLVEGQTFFCASCANYLVPPLENLKLLILLTYETGGIGGAEAFFLFVASKEAALVATLLFGTADTSGAAFEL